jgi:RNA polymerase sigma-70 factor (ECF subfamily)
MYPSFEAASLVGSSAESCDASEESNATEHHLVRQLQAGNEIAYRKFVEGYQFGVYRVAYGILGNRDEADEVAQKVFARAYLSVKGLDARSSLYTWIFGIAVSECYTFLRTKRLKLGNESNSTLNPSLMRVQMGLDSNSRSEQVVLQRDLLNTLLGRIPDEDRCLLLLRELEGYSVAKLSEVTGLNESTIKARLFRTRQHLAAQLDRG